MRKRMLITAGIAAFIAAIAGATQTPIASAQAGPRVIMIPTCTERLASMMRDPDSLEVTIEGGAASIEPLEEPHEGWGLVGEYRARNGFGGTNSDIFFCTTTKSGYIDELETGEGLSD